MPTSSPFSVSEITPSVPPRPTSGDVAVVDFCYPQAPEAGGVFNPGCCHMSSRTVGATVGSG